MNTSPRPFVFINMAMTADGKIATTNRVVSSFGSARDQEHLYELRSTADAVMAGARTLDLNAIKLGPGGKRFRKERVRRRLAEFNLRVIVSGSGSIDPQAEVFKHRFSPIVVLTTERPSHAVRRNLSSLADEVLVCGSTEIDFNLALRHLRQKWKVKRLLCEGGGELNSALFRLGLVDELHLTVCPNVFGGRHAPTIADGKGIPRLADAAHFRLAKFTPLKNELFLVFRPSRERSSAAPHSAQERRRISMNS